MPTTPVRRPSRATSRVAALVSAAAATAALVAGCGSGALTSGPTSATEATGTSTSTAATTTASPSSPATVRPAPTTVPSAAAAVSAEAAGAVIGRAMVAPKLMAALQLTPSVTEPVGTPGAWSITCNVTLKSDSLMISGGYQQWERDGQTYVLENLTRYPAGGAPRALAEAAEAARSCTRFTTSGVVIRMIGTVEATASVLTLCQQTPHNVACLRASVHHDHVSQILAFGPSQASALRLSQLVAGMADAQLAKQGL